VRYDWLNHLEESLMSKTNHTSGVLRIHSKKPRRVLSEGGYVIANCVTNVRGTSMILSDREQEANAQRIAHTWNCHNELLEALRNQLDDYTALVNCGDCGSWNPEEEPVVIASRAAIKKAEGQSQ